MPQRCSPRSVHAALMLLLILAPLLAGAALGRLLLPPGRLGRGPDFAGAGAHAQAAAAAARAQAAAAAARASSPPRPAVQLAIEPEQLRGDLPSVALSAYSVGPRMGVLTGEPHRMPGGPVLEQQHDWRLELQVSLSWQYAGGASSRVLHAPVSAPIGEPRESGGP